MIVFILFTIFVILFEILKTLTIKLEVQDVKFLLPKNGNNKHGKAFIKIYILKKFKIAEINLKNVSSNRGRIDKIIKSNVGIKSINFLEIVRKSDFEIENMDLKIYLSTENAALTSIGVATIASAIAITLKDKIKNSRIQKYEICPIYKNENFLKIEFNGIFSLKIANIIDIIKLLIRKGRDDKNDGTSNRRTYAYSNE